MHDNERHEYVGGSRNIEPNAVNQYKNCIPNWLDGKIGMVYEEKQQSANREKDEDNPQTFEQ